MATNSSLRPLTKRVLLIFATAQKTNEKIWKHCSCTVSKIARLKFLRLADKTNEKKLEIDYEMLYKKKRPHTKGQQKVIFDNASSKKKPLSDRQQPVKSMHTKL